MQAERVELMPLATQHIGQGKYVQGEGLFLGTQGWKILPGAGLQRMLSHRSPLDRLILFWRCPGEGNNLVCYPGEENPDLADLIAEFLPASLDSRFYIYKVSHI